MHTNLLYVFLWSLLSSLESPCGTHWDKTVLLPFRNDTWGWAGIWTQSPWKPCLGSSFHSPVLTDDIPAEKHPLICPLRHKHVNIILLPVLTWRGKTCGVMYNLYREIYIRSSRPLIGRENNNCKTVSNWNRRYLLLVMWNKIGIPTSFCSRNNDCCWLSQDES